MRLLAAAIQELQKELGETKVAPAGFFCLTAAPLTPNEPSPQLPDLLRRINALLAAGGDVLLFRQSELYNMKTLVSRYTQAPVRFAVGLSLMIEAFEGIYGNLEGRLLEALARLLAQNVRIYAYPMSSTELRERLKAFSRTAVGNGVRRMEWFLLTRCGTRRLLGTCMPIFSPATFSSRCKFPQP